jgi:hypothetical protein
MTCALRKLWRTSTSSCSTDCHTSSSSAKGVLRSRNPRGRLLSSKSLEARRKELTKVKDDLLKQTKTKQTTADNVKAQLDLLMKVPRSATLAVYCFLTLLQTATEIQKKVDELVPAPAAPPPEAEDVPMEP